MIISHDADHARHHCSIPPAASYFIYIQTHQSEQLTMSRFNIRATPRRPAYSALIAYYSFEVLYSVVLVLRSSIMIVLRLVGIILELCRGAYEV